MNNNQQPLNFLVNLAVQTLVNSMLAKPQQRTMFHLMSTVNIGEPENAQIMPTDLYLILDRSGSTGEFIPKSSDIKMDKIKESAEAAINNLNENDRVAIVSFENYANTLLPLTFCDGNGKNQAIRMVWGIRSDGGTAFSTGLQEAVNGFSKDESTNRNRVVLFLTDGENSERANPLEQCMQLKDLKATMYIAGLGVKPAYEKLLIDMAKTNSVETSFRSLQTSNEVLNFFADVQAAASTTLVKNARLEVRPVSFAEVQNFELVTRCGQPNYLPAQKGALELSIGDLGINDELDFYFNMQLVQPADIKADTRRSFGQIQLFGEIDGSEQLLRTQNIVVGFTGEIPAGTQPNQAVIEMMQLAAVSREFYAAGNTTGAEAAKHIQAAEQAIKKTQPFNREGAIAAFKTSIGKVQEAIRTNNPDIAAQEANKATKGFSAADRAAAFKNN